MRDFIEDAIKGKDADYLEIRVEESQASHIRYQGKELDGIGSNNGKGGNIRALVGGGWGFVCFNELSGLRDKVEQAIHQARLVNGPNRRLAPVEPVVDIVKPHIVRDPATISILDKKQYLDEYNEIIWSTPNIQSSVIGYQDSRKKRYFANSEGSYIEQERIDVTLRVMAIAQRNGDVQQAGFSVGSLGDVNLIKTLHDDVADISQKAVDMLAAPSVDGKQYTVVLDPILAGVFIHEAFGHLSEADHVYENNHLQEIMVLGKRFGGTHLNVVDGGAVPSLRGSFQYDDEGTAATRTYLIKEGELVGRLHSRETAGKMGEAVTGNARSISYNFPPIVRMTNTFIEPGRDTVKDILSDIKDGIYVKNWYGGMTSMEMFTFSAGEAYRIRNGKIEEMVRPVMLSGNLFSTLKNLDAIANDLEMNEGGGCGKGGQSPLPVSNGSPHIRIQKCLVGGS